MNDSDTLGYYEVYQERVSGLSEIVLIARGICVGALLLIIARCLLVSRSQPAAKWLALFAASLMAYCLAPVAWQYALMGPIVIFVSILAPPLFWLFCRSLFEDCRDRDLLNPMTSAALLAYLVVVLTRVSQLNTDVTQGMAMMVFYVTYGFQLVFVALAFVSLARSLPDDLVQQRRAFRVAVLAVSGVYIMLVLLVEVMFAGTPVPTGLETLHSLLLAAMTVGLALWFLLLAPDDLLVTPGIPQLIREDTLKALPQIEQRWLEQLQVQMEEALIYRRNDLSIGELAKEIGLPEHQLRKLINHHLGYRNFREYLNGYRLEEAAARLRSAEDEKTPILTIALEVGFGSITPFNRAFRARYGLAPSAYRAEAPFQASDS